MNRINLKVLYLVLFAGLHQLSCASNEKAQEGQIIDEKKRKTVFVILDGIPADVLESVNTPIIDKISAEGGYTRALMGGDPETHTKTPTISAVGYNSLLTGTWAYKHNVWGNKIKEPNYNYWNIFRIARENDPNSKIAVYSTWEENRTKLIGESLPEAGNIKMDYAFDGFENDTVRFPHKPDRKFILDIDELVSKEAGRHIAEEAPDLSWVYLEFTDDIGHKFGDSPEMINAVKLADKQVERIWEGIKERENNHDEEWLIVITTDHGRDEETGKHHGGHSARQMEIWIVTNSKNTNERFSEDKPEMVDIVPSIVKFMGYEIPDILKNELDGAPFIGDVSVADFRAVQKEDSLYLSWTPYSDGKAEIIGSTTNTYDSLGVKDDFEVIANVNLGEENATIPANGFIKLAIRTKSNTVSYWPLRGSEK